MDTEKQLNDLEEQLNNENSVPKKIKIVIGILIIFIILLIILSITAFIYFDQKLKEERNKGKPQNNENSNTDEYLLEINGFKEKWYDIYGNRTINISYLDEGVIPNTYKKKGGVNYIPELGEVNDGNDYESYGLNVYDLYIPYSSLKKKKKHNGIILFVHGGGFENNTKEETEGLATRFAKLGFITANIEYTNCLEKYKQKNVYRILDEITACIKNIKLQLKSLDFDETKLELALYGISAGAQLCMVYGFSNKNNEIPIKFLMNSVGPISLYEKNWYKPNVKNVTLDNIENYLDVEAAEKNNTFTKIDSSFVIKLMNSMSGRLYSEDELKDLVIDNVIQTDNEKYKKMNNFAKYGYPIEVIANTTIPMLCLYGGSDDLVGIAHYCYLKKAYIDNKAEDKIKLIYMKHAGHERFHHGFEEDIIAMKEMNYQMVDFGKKYFTWDEDEV